MGLTHLLLCKVTNQSCDFQAMFRGLRYRIFKIAICGFLVCKKVDQVWTLAFRGGMRRLVRTDAIAP